MENIKDYKTLFKFAFISSLIILIIIPLQIIVFSIYSMPKNVLEWFNLFNNNLVIGIFHSDLFILIDNIFIAIIYIAFYHTLKETNKGLIQIGLILGVIGITAYFSSNKTFEMLEVANSYAKATTDSEKSILFAAGRVLIYEWQGTAFDIYYILNGIALLIFSFLMFKSKYYNKSTAIFGIVSAILMMIPPTVGMIGLVFSLLSLLPWYIFTIKYAKVFRELSIIKTT